MKYIINLTLLLFGILNVHGTEIIKKDYEQGHIQLMITQVEVDSFDTIKLINENYREMQLICGNNPAYKNKKPHIQFKNYYNIHVADFFIENDQKCQDLKNYLIATFEAINSDAPLEIELDVQRQSVSKIIYPDLDPYLLYKSDGDIINHNKGFKGNLDLN